MRYEKNRKNKNSSLLSKIMKGKVNWIGHNIRRKETLTTQFEVRGRNKLILIDDVKRKSYKRT